MMNIIRADLYRVVRGKAIYITLLILTIMSVLISTGSGTVGIASGLLMDYETSGEPTGGLAAVTNVRRTQEMDAQHNRLQEEGCDIEEVLYDAVSRKVQIKFYLDALRGQDGILEESRDALWRAVVEGCTVGTGKTRFALKDGTAVEWEI